VRAVAFALVVVPVLAAWASACEGESSFVIPVEDAGAPDGRYEATCTEFAKTLCARAFACNPPVAFTWTDVPQCVARNTLHCELIASDPDVIFDPQQLQTCIEADAGECPSSYGIDCFGAGRAPNGATCVWAEACQSGNCVVTIDVTAGYESPCGVCRPLPCNGACPDGQQCSTSPDGGSSCIPMPCGGCPAGQRCFGPVDGGATCTPPLGPGQACTRDADCEDFFYCGPDGTCSAVARIGDACGGAAMGRPCGDADAYCDAKGQCSEVASLPYGASCDQIESVCAGAGTCDPTDSQCLPPASDGDVCEDFQGLECLPPARCIANRCLFPGVGLCAGSGVP